MSGHSKWSTIKRKKGAVDAKRARIFTRLIREITVAARTGGGDPNGNPRLRSAVAEAKMENMPKENIDRAIKRGTGELDGTVYEEITYEGYGPGGVAVLVDTMTDNKNRTVADLRHYFSKHGGNLGEFGCVSWMFDKKGLLTVDKEAISEEKLMDVALEAGAEDVKEEESEHQVLTHQRAGAEGPDGLLAELLAGAEVQAVAEVDRLEFHPSRVGGLYAGGFPEGDHGVGDGFEVGGHLEVVLAVVVAVDALVVVLREREDRQYQESRAQGCLNKVLHNSSGCRDCVPLCYTARLDECQ